MKNYSKDYSQKISYYQAQLANAVAGLNIQKIKFYTDKLEYFINRELEANGDINIRSLIF